jgi:ribosomal protein S18 acetylase RimI-like enzyme
MTGKHSLDIVVYENTRHRDQVIRMWRNEFGYEAARNDPAFVIDKKIAVGDGLFWVAVCKGSVLGTIMAGYDGHRGWIYSMAVTSSQRHQGIGSMLLNHAEQQLMSRGCVKINLQILKENEEIQRFYQANGYALEDRLSMGKQIDENLLDMD